MRPPRVRDRPRPVRTVRGRSSLSPEAARRAAVFGTVVVALFAILVVRLWFLQVVGARGFEAQAVGNSVRTINIPAPRGTILDRNGEVLAGNREAWDIVATPEDLVEGTDKRSQVSASGTKTLHKLARAIDEPERRLRSLMVNGSRKAAAKSVVLKADIPSDLRIALAERIRQYPGIRLQATSRRDYPFRSSLGHVLGYVGRISPEELEARKLQGYRNDAILGKAGLELRYEEYLRGKDGEIKIEVDGNGQPIGRGTLSRKEPKPGLTLQTTIDIKVQQALENAIAEQVLIKSAPNGGGGGVVLDIATGEVVAMASFPAIDPRAFSRNRVRELKEYSRKGGRNAYFNRPLESYSPASTFKPVTAIAALNPGYFEPTDFLSSPKTVKLYTTFFNNFRKVELPDMQFRRAIAMSSDTFFYQVGAKIYKRSGENADGDNKLKYWSDQLGMGRPTGIDLPGERGGDLPDKAWKIRTFESFKNKPRNWNRWLPGDTINMSIGQGFLRATPLQMARAYAAILDDEHRLQTPAIGRSVLDPTSTNVDVVADLEKGRKQSILPPFNPGVLEAVRGGMYDATNTSEGTASGVFGALGGIVAGKTGTSENGKTLKGVPRADHSWFVGYAPVNGDEKPKYVVAVIIEYSGLGGAAAAPAACKALAAAVPYNPSRCGSGSRPAVAVGAD